MNTKIFNRFGNSFIQSRRKKISLTKPYCHLIGVFWSKDYLNVKLLPKFLVLF